MAEETHTLHDDARVPHKFINRLTRYIECRDSTCFTGPATMSSHVCNGNLRRAQLPVGAGGGSFTELKRGPRFARRFQPRRSCDMKTASPRQNQHKQKMLYDKNYYPAQWCSMPTHSFCKESLECRVTIITTLHKTQYAHPFNSKESTECRVGGWRSNMNVQYLILYPGCSSHAA